MSTLTKKPKPRGQVRPHVGRSMEPTWPKPFGVDSLSLDVVKVLQAAQNYTATLEEENKYLEEKLAGHARYIEILEDRLSELDPDRAILSQFYAFVGSLDREEDRFIREELHIWGLQHSHEAIVRILIPGVGGHGYERFRRLFSVTDVPTLVFIYSTSPPRGMKFAPGFFSQNLLGQNYEKLRRVLERLHSHCALHSKPETIAWEIFLKDDLAGLLGAAWKQLKGLISFSIEK